MQDSSREPAQEIASDQHYYKTPVLHRDWLEIGLKGKIDTLKLIEKGTWPKSIEGAAIITTALWLLRCVYGSDLESAVAVRQIALAEVQRDQHFAQWHPGGCNNPACAICHEQPAGATS